MPDRKCVACKDTKPTTKFSRCAKSGFQSRCKECARAYQREYERTPDAREANRRRSMKRYAELRTTQEGRQKHAALTMKWKIANPEKYKAQYALGNNVSRGKIKRQPCEVCGNPKTHGHHDDYSKPLEVRWLCPKHHAETHRASATPALNEVKHATTF